MDTKTLHPQITAAYRVLETGEPISRAEAALLADLPGELALDLAALANKVKKQVCKWYGIASCMFDNECKIGGVRRKLQVLCSVTPQQGRY